MRRKIPTDRSWLFLTLILIVAGFLRLYRIDAQSFWNDEGNSARLAERSVQLILEGARGDIHPPGYYLVLHGWRAAVGQSEFALRGLSALCSLLLVAVAFRLGHGLFGDGIVAMGGAALLAINPFDIYYAQEARMYAMLAVWSLGSSWALAAWRQARERHDKRIHGYWIAYVIMTVGGLYTHYAFPSVIAAQGASVLFWAWRDRRSGYAYREVVWWALGQMTAGMLYLPWLPVAWHQVTTWAPPSEASDVHALLLDFWRLLNFGQTIATEAVSAGLIVAGIALLLGLFSLKSTTLNSSDRIVDSASYHVGGAFLVALIIVPAGLILGFGLYREAYRKFLLVGVAPLSLLMARGIVSGWRLIDAFTRERRWIVRLGLYVFGVSLMVPFFMDSIRSLGNLYYDESFARDDYRGIARYIRERARPDDAIILNAPNQWEVFTYYFPDDNLVLPLARERPLDFETNRRALEGIAENHKRIFAIFWGDVESDPTRFIEGWLEEHAFKAGETWYGDVRLAVYAVSAAIADRPVTPLNVSFVTQAHPVGATIYLDGYTILNDEVAGGDIMQLALFWRSEETIAERYKVFVHIYSEIGALVAQTDSEPGAALRPTMSWRPGEVVQDRYGVLIPEDLPEGVYSVTVGLYDLIDPADRLLVMWDGAVLGDRFELTRVSVVRAD